MLSTCSDCKIAVFTFSAQTKEKRKGFIWLKIVPLPENFFGDAHESSAVGIKNVSLKFDNSICFHRPVASLDSREVDKVEKKTKQIWEELGLSFSSAPPTHR